MKFTLLPPDSQTAFTPPGDVAWRDWFLRLQAFLGQIDTSLIGTGGGSVAVDSSMMPYLIESDETFLIPIKKQGLFSQTITVEGTLVVNGYLIQVD